MTAEFNVLVSCAGRRVQLIDGFREALRRSEIRGHVLAMDVRSDSPACHFADHSFAVPPVLHPDYPSAVLQICAENQVGLLVPTIDSELEIYASVKDEFAAAGTTISVSSAACVEISRDKRKTHSWLRDNGFPVADQLSATDARQTFQSLRYPLIVKPIFGSMSIGITKVEAPEEFPARLPDDAIVQSFVAGDEYTVSVYVDSEGKCVVAVPRLRLETRGGEVSKGRTVRSAELEELAIQIAERLPGAFGAINVQVIEDRETSSWKVIEINARFGGGDPLAWVAGADIPLLLVREVSGVMPASETIEWIPDVSMARFDRAVYTLPDGTIFHG